MIIDCHGHYTTAPKQLETWRKNQIAGLSDAAQVPSKGSVSISDDEIRQSLEGAQLKLQRERGSDVTIFSPRASVMGHHVGNATTSQHWTEHSNDLIHRVCGLYPDNFVGVCQLPQSPGTTLENSIHELERCVNDFGFIGCNLNPDPSGGHWNSPSLSDKYWYPFYEKMVELDVPAMIHVSGSCLPNFHTTGTYYINADTTAFMQFLMSDLFKDFPAIRFIIPHGGGAAPYHWGRYRGLAQDNKRPPLEESILKNVYFDTCVYHLPGIELLLKVVPIDNILFGSEMVGAVRGIDPRTGQYYDDTKKYLDALPLSEDDRYKLFEGNARKVYPRIANKLKEEVNGMKVALAGQGAFGIKHLEAMGNIPGIEVVTLAGGNPAGTEEVAKKFKIPHWTTDLGESLKQPGVEAVILTTPTQLHAAQAIQSMRAGKHVMIEIPMADTLDDSEKICAVQKETGLVAMAGHTRRFNPSHQWVHKKVVAGELKVLHMNVQTFFFRRTNMNAAGKPRSWTDHLLWHHSCHTVDLFGYQTRDTVTHANALQGPVHPELGIAMDMSIQLKTAGGAICTLSLSFNNKGPQGTFFRYICDNGTYVAYYDDLVDGDQNKIDLSHVDVSMNGIELQDREFFAAIKEHREPNSSVQQVLPTMRTLDKLEHQVGREGKAPLKQRA